MANRMNSDTTPEHDKAVDRYFQALQKVRVETKPTGTDEVKIDIENETAREQKIRNDNAEQDIRLKRMTLRLLFIFLGSETVLLFVFTFFQAIQRPDGFYLDEWSFRTVVGATILQITGMLLVAVRYLFPNDNS